MNRVAGSAGAYAVDAGVGAACGLAGQWLAAAAAAGQTWALQAVVVAEGVNGRFGGAAALPPDAPWLLHAVQMFGPILLAVAAFLAVAAVAWRAGGLLSLGAACTAFWLAMPIVSEVARLGWGRRASLEVLAQSVGLPTGGELGEKVIAVAALIGIVAALRSGLRRAGTMPLAAFAIPMAALSLFVDSPQLDGRLLERLGFAYAPAMLAAATGLAAWIPRPERQPVDRRRGGLVALCGLLALVVPQPVAEGRAGGDAVRWAEEVSGGWRIRFEESSFPAARRLQWMEALDERSRSYRLRLGLESSADPVRASVAGTNRGMRSLAGSRRAGDSFVLNLGAGPVLMAGRDAGPEDPRAEPLLLMRLAWGEPASRAMALALGRYAVGRFGEDSLPSAARQVACEERVYSPKEVFAVGEGFLSPLVRDVLGGAWVEDAVGRHGVEALRTLYKGGIAESLELCPDCSHPCDSVVAEGLPRRPRPGYLKGISFSHEVVADGGYGSVAAGGELERIRDLGANAVALVPYAFTAAPDETSIRVRTLETDARLARSVRQARGLGLKIILKPHLWAGRRFHGSIAFERKARFDAWFEDYRRWMLHFARFAEMHRLSALSIGNELAGLTVHEDDWRALIAAVRRVYRGPVTYSAHWEEEVTRIGFWDELDWIGVNFYFPIATAGAEPASDTPEMLEAAQAIDAVRTRFGKPVLFTEVGFPALATAAARPWEENSSALNPGLQAQCYAAWLERFAARAGVEGMFWWKWPSHGRGGQFDSSHSPLGKPAMGVLRDWYGQH